MKKKNHIMNIVKASRKGSRDAEIELYGHSIYFKKVFKNKKKYNRKVKFKDEINYFNSGD